MAVPYTTVLNIFENINYLLEDVPEAVTIRAFITAEMVLNPAWAVIILDMFEINDILKRLTGCTVATGSTLNCYPRGYVTTQCFDLDGNEIP